MNEARKHFRQTLHYLAHANACRAGGDVESALVWEEMAAQADARHTAALEREMTL